MDDSSIKGRVEMLCREIAMIQQAELNYRGHRNYSLEDKAEHDKREFRILAIREELRKFRDQRGTASNALLGHHPILLETPIARNKAYTIYIRTSPPSLARRRSSA